MRKHRVALIVFASALLIMTIMATRVFVLHDVQVPRSEGRAAAVDPWLALDRIFSSTNQVRRYSSQKEIDYATAGLVIAAGGKIADYDAKTTGTGRRGQPLGLAGWVAGGGRLIIAWPRYLDDEAELALPSFPELVPRESDGGDDQSAQRAKGLYLGQQVDIEAPGSLSFEPAEGRAGFVAISGGNKVRVALIRSGKGWALAGARPLFLENRRLADTGNRAFAAALFEDGPPGVVWLPAPSRGETATKSESLASRSAFLPTAGTALLLCLVLLWYRAPRFGPLIPESSADRHSILERFRAEGRFLFDRGAGDEVLRRIGAAPLQGIATRRHREGQAILRAVEERVRRNADRKEGRNR